MNDTISVLMPVYNREQFLERAVNSILEQAYTNWKLFIYDDGSSDKTTDIIAKLIYQDSRIYAIYGGHNKGVAFARNRLLEHCPTKYACWLDSDDTIHPQRIEKQVAVINNNLVFCGWENFQKKQKGTTLGFATLMFPVDLSIRFKETMQWGGEDWHWIERMRLKYGETLVEDILYYINFHGDRIGTWKRKIDKDWGGKYELKDIEGLTYEEVIKKYKEENQ